jgi:hypothetical protein
MAYVTLYSFKPISYKVAGIAVGIFLDIDESVKMVLDYPVKVYPNCKLYDDDSLSIFQWIKYQKEPTKNPDALIVIVEEDTRKEAEKVVKNAQQPALVLFKEEEGDVIDAGIYGSQIISPDDIYNNSVPSWWNREVAEKAYEKISEKLFSKFYGNEW